MLAKLAERLKNGNKDPAQRAKPTHTLIISKATGARCHLGGGWPTKPTSTYTNSYSERGDGRCFIIFKFKTRRKGANEAPTTHERTRTHANPRKTQTHTHHIYYIRGGAGSMTCAYACAYILYLSSCDPAHTMYRITRIRQYAQNTGCCIPRASCAQRIQHRGPRPHVRQNSAFEI